MLHILEAVMTVANAVDSRLDQDWDWMHVTYHAEAVNFTAFDKTEGDQQSFRWLSATPISIICMGPLFGNRHR